jgi:C-terminal processing protease CtpA/Prc
MLNTCKEYDVDLQRRAANDRKFSPFRTGETFRLLTPKIGYVDLERLKGTEVDAMFNEFKDTDAIIMDMRGYPQGTAWSIAPRLTERSQPVAAVFRRNVARVDNPEGNEIGTLLFEQHIPPTDKPRYKGKTVMLIDDRAISQSEHSGLFYKSAGGTVFIGSGTTGANGDVTFFTAPGGIRINFSGHDVRWPDGKQLQRVGLIPDIEAHPTIAGIRAGKDEILDRAITYIEKEDRK